MSTALQRWDRLAAEVNGRAAVGMKGVRDPDNVCEDFNPGAPASWGACDSDGHYLCAECIYLDVESWRKLKE